MVILLIDLNGELVIYFICNSPGRMHTAAQSAELKMLYAQYIAKIRNLRRKHFFFFSDNQPVCHVCSLLRISICT